MTTLLSSLVINPLRLGRTLSLSLLVLMIGFSALSYGDVKPPPAPKAPRGVSFSRDLQPLLDIYCTSCHLSTSPEGQTVFEGKFAYRTLVNQPSVLSKLLRVVPGKPEESFLIQKLEGTRPGIGDSMPIRLLLDSEQIDLFRKWIAQGALNN